MVSLPDMRSFHAWIGAYLVSVVGRDATLTCPSQTLSMLLCGLGESRSANSIYRQVRMNTQHIQASVKAYACLSCTLLLPVSLARKYPVSLVSDSVRSDDQQRSY